MKIALQRKTDLALRALATLDDAERRIQAPQLAAAIGTTSSYLPQVMAPLVKNGWVDSERGPTGGYRLAERLEDISVLAVIEAVEGPTDRGECVLTGGPCPGQTECALHQAWVSARDALMARLAAQSVRVSVDSIPGGTSS